ncbi:hypothetical protein ABUJ22_01555 [Salmonella enterica subsp. enterica serovar Larochelle]|uniref:hypothetical protein n=1 Tax=Salmonella enterica TaxID=28901 RepID=UPI003315220B
MKNRRSSKIYSLHLWVQIVAQIVTIAAAIVVGFWGYYSAIYVNKEKEVTDYTLEELKQKTTQTPHIQAKVEPIVVKGDSGLTLLQVKVALSNLGTKESRVTLDDNSLALIPVEFSEGKPVFQQPINLLSSRYAGNLHRIPLQFVDIGAGETYEFTFVHSINATGTYLIHFLALNDMAPSEDKVTTYHGIPYRYSVGADEYIVVK